MDQQPLRLAVLLSGGGRTLVNLQEHIAAGKLDARIEAAISSQARAGGVARAGELGLRTRIVERRALSEAFQQGITEAMGQVDLVCMAGFLHLWRIPDEYQGRVINIHPALLPRFGGRGMYGHHVHQAVIAAGVDESGCTVHFCDNEYDHGPIILQRRVPVLPTDTPDELAARVFVEECKAYPQAVRLFCENRVKLEGGKLTIR